MKLGATFSPADVIIKGAQTTEQLAQWFSISALQTFLSIFVVGSFLGVKKA